MKQSSMELDKEIARLYQEVNKEMDILVAKREFRRSP